jgi:hypothetical protein
MFLILYSKNRGLASPASIIKTLFLPISEYLAESGIEPNRTAHETVVLPLHYPAGNTVVGTYYEQRDLNS